MWWWHKVRRTDIRQDAREAFERYGVGVIAYAVGKCGQGPGTPGEVVGFVTAHHKDAVAWLTEKRDVEARHADRIETLEWAILIFVVLGVVVESITLIRGIH